MLSVTGMPYDTLRGVIGITGDGNGSLKEFGINYEQLDLLPDGTPDYDGMETAITPKHRMVYIQRSRGYSLRPSLTVEEIERIVKIAKRRAPDCIVMVDNCYGEYVQKTEPTAVGADLMAGSLIKNPGGGIAPTGGYIAGRRDLIESCAYRLTTPGTGREIGCTLGNNRELFMGTFHAPNVTGEALKTAVFTAALFEGFGFDVTPRYDEPRADIIQAVQLREREALCAFIRGIQQGAPVDSFVVPEPSPMPGYDCDVIMASGSFTFGSSIELSADAPLREPCCGSDLLIRKILRGKWGFQGHFVSDCWAISDFHLHHHITTTAPESAALAIKMGCDVNCGNTYLHLLRALEDGLITEDDITTAAERLFTTRFMLGEFDENCEYNSIPYEVVECPEHLALSEEAARRSVVLLKNVGILPLDKAKIKTIGVIGPNANDRMALIGNYHGTASRYITVLEGIQDYVGDDVRVRLINPLRPAILEDPAGAYV